MTQQMKQYNWTDGGEQKIAVTVTATVQVDNAVTVAYTLKADNRLEQYARTDFPAVCADEFDLDSAVADAVFEFADEWRKWGYEWQLGWN